MPSHVGEHISYEEDKGSERILTPDVAKIKSDLQALARDLEEALVGQDYTAWREEASKTLHNLQKDIVAETGPYYTGRPVNEYRSEVEKLLSSKLKAKK